MDEALNHKEDSYFLTQLVGALAYLGDRRIGKLHDLVAVDEGKVAEVKHLQITRPFGEPPLLVPLERTQLIGTREVILDIDEPQRFIREPRPEEVLLRDYVLDKKVLDLAGREVEVAYDLRLVRVSNRIYVVDVDIGRYGLLVRVGLKWLAGYLAKIGVIRKRLIPWSYVQALPPDLGALAGELKLNVIREKLSDIHPADLADILEQLDSSQRAVILNRLDTGHASDTLEEIEPAVQRDIIFSLSKERVAQLVNDMTPGQAADVLSVLPADQKPAILKLLEPGTVEKIKDILERQDSAILNFGTAHYFKSPPETTVKTARQRFRDAAKDMDVLMYFYVVAPSGKLLGVLDIRELFAAEDDTLLQDLMVENVITLREEDNMKRAVDLFLRYGFRALPITDSEGVILGVVPYRDVMTLKHRIL